MALVIADRVKETTTTTGTGTVTLLGASTGYQSFAAIGNGNTTFYCIASQSNSEWEVGIGTYTSSGTTLARTTVLSNSSGTQPSALSFSAGTKDVFVTYPSEKSVNLDANGVAVIGTGSALGGTTNPIIAAVSSANQYIQEYIYNSNNGVSSSADFVAYANNSTDAHGWADVGFTSQSYADTTYTVTGPNEAYLFGSAPSGSGKTGNLVLATDSTGTENVIQMYTGGFTQAKTAWRAKVDSTGLKAPQVNASNGLHVNAQTVTENYTVAATDNAFSVGPIAISSGVSVTVSSGAKWVVI